MTIAIQRRAFQSLCGAAKGLYYKNSFEEFSICTRDSVVGSSDTSVYAQINPGTE